MWGTALLHLPAIAGGLGSCSVFQPLRYPLTPLPTSQAWALPSCQHLRSPVTITWDHTRGHGHTLSLCPGTPCPSTPGPTHTGREGVPCPVRANLVSPSSLTPWHLPRLLSRTPRSPASPPFFFIGPLPLHRIPPPHIPAVPEIPSSMTLAQFFFLPGEKQIIGNSTGKDNLLINGASPRGSLSGGKYHGMPSWKVFAKISSRWNEGSHVKSKTIKITQCRRQYKLGIGGNF